MAGTLKGARLERALAVYDAEGTYAEIARRFQMGWSTVKLIKSGGHHTVNTALAAREREAPMAPRSPRHYQPFRDGTYS